MRAEWNPLFWEPVEGTGERLMAGVVLRFDGQWSAHRVIRDDTLEALYGKAAGSPKQLIEHALNLCQAVAEAGGQEALGALEVPLMGLYVGQSRVTDAFSALEAVRQAALLHGSLAHMESWDDLEEADAPAPEEVNKRFATEVRDAVIHARPELAKNFNRAAKLLEGGVPVKFGYLSEVAVLHFSVLHPVRQAASVRDARARLWELSRAKTWAGLAKAALITAVPRADEVTLGSKQRDALRANQVEIEREADAVEMRVYAVTSVDEARSRVLELAA
ncbi:hypothetical protein [Ramlibacter rhizophilus]|uniref:Uncharacterized protein n=1 Tax=Ramlibacter rhizophilus TaxID=1781167 RepID=A0A4Z0C0B0_9BURK|nr:hypothetical protein [Ramlibacter rhizophilus]TFZ05037.1 hypothetical protein EZ242_04625 [Ramlibacter rhizophilus]